MRFFSPTTFFTPTRLYGCVLGLLLCVTHGYAQQVHHTSQKKGSTMRAARWWIGLKTGLHYTEPLVLTPYQVFSSTASLVNDQQYAKQYDQRSQHQGYQVGLVAGFAFSRHIALVIQPSFTHAAFGYRTRYSWSDSTGTLSINQAHRLAISAVETPLLLRLSLSFKKLQVYGQVGGYYGYLINASKEVQTSNLETVGETTQTFEGGTQTTRMRNQVARSWKGLTGGGGISYDVNYVRIGLECNYRYGLDNRSNPNNRFADSHLVAGAYDVPDDYQLRNLEFSLVLSMPLDNLIHLKKSEPETRRKRRMGNPAF